MLVDALMVPSMTRRLVAAVKKTTRKPIATLVNTHHHLDHTGGNRFFRGVTMIASEKCREALEPGFPPSRSCSASCRASRASSRCSRWCSRP